MQPPLYTIKHIRLDEPHAPLHTFCMVPRSYLVFWWGQIALGHLYLEIREKLTAETFYVKLRKALKPALHQYAPQLVEDDEAWQQLISEGNTAALQDAFAGHNPESIPAEVPVSVVICTRNRAVYLDKCLEQLHQLSCVPHEIIVVDNAPLDNSTYEVASKYKKVVYVKEPRAGLDIARNTGALSASCEVVAFTDDDVLVHPMWVYWVWQTFQDKSVAAMTGLIIAAQLHTRAQVNFEKYWSFNRGYADKVYTGDFIHSTLSIGPPVWEIGAGANMAFRKSVFEQVGLFNEYLDVGAAGCNGDSEMWYRILDKGLTIHYNPRAIVFHEHRRETGRLKNQIFYYMRGFTVAALLQQRQKEEAGYKRHLYYVLPKFYLELIRKGFPYYRSRTSTIWAEMTGIVSGLIYYKKNQQKLLKSLSK
ncbi:glycosyltransferase family 2 protein [Pontibacter chinhatensis]|uniref:Glycosyl transferase family 2 n=1 Tax=Pontibacter chinhatensis TaxID=1436961 RepID=A0A1I2R1J2_9BACT|nr:glycosyltransferase [Pontibacter chinhatensis]SFG34200.1 Glycosyl transferase family 2 [Pontibacter chinhatensis]